MSDASPTQVAVFLDLDGVPTRAGVAYFTHGRQRVTTSFAYDPAYVSRPGGVDLDPSLPRRSGQQYVAGLPGSFQDSAPDRWGRNLIDKRWRIAERASRQRLPDLTAVDYLLGVSDLTRQGDLRYRIEEDGPFLDPGTTVPRLVSLPRLLAAADQVTRDPDDQSAVETLLDAGSGSLGGARPKASVLADDGRLLIAKFPHPGDEWDVMAWEKTALDLAELAGIAVPTRRLVTVAGRQVLLLERFDRAPKGRRVGYLSAMSLLGAQDGEDRDYVDIAETLPEHGSAVNADLVDLFRRVALSVAVHNTDDHLRNLGFLRAPGGWRLSPLFDVNPEPDSARGRVTGIAGAVRPDEEVEGLLALAPYCRLGRDAVVRIVRQIVDGVGGWRATAARNGIPSAEQARFADVLDGRAAKLASAIS